MLIEDPVPEQARVSHLRIIQRSGERMNRLIQDLLSVTTIEAGRLSIAPQKMSVPELFREASETLGPIAKEKSITFTVNAADDLPAVRADHARVLQVIGNLVGNAVKFTPAGGTITLSAIRADGRVQCSVADTGPGIPAAQIPRLFGKFWQAKRGDGPRSRTRPRHRARHRRGPRRDDRSRERDREGKCLYVHASRVERRRRATGYDADVAAHDFFYAARGSARSR